MVHEIDLQRSPTALRDQMRIVERFIGAHIDDDDAAAMGFVRGYIRGVVLHGPREIGRTDVPEPPIREPRPPCCDLCQTLQAEHSQRFEEEVCHHLDNSGKGLYLLKLVWPAVRTLDSRSQMILHLHCRENRSYREIVAWRGPFGLNGLGMRSHHTAIDWHDRALEAVARLVWDDDGGVRW